MCNFRFLEAVKTIIKTKLLLPTLTDNQVFLTGFMYNLVPRLSLEKGDSVKCGCGRRMRTAGGGRRMADAEGGRTKKKKVIEKKMI